jgi:hypothetical protein
MSDSCISTNVVCQQNVPEFSPRSAQILFAGQARLLAARAEADLPVDIRSLVNLVRAYYKMALEKA